MSALLVSLMALVIGQQLFALPLSLGHGLSLENALLYVVAGVLAFKVVLQSNFRFELRGLHACFALLLIYAALSIPLTALVTQPPGYRLLAAITSFKVRLFDQFVFFAVFFYGLQGSRSALTVLKILLLMTAIANLVALLDAWGFVEATGLVARDDGRAQGVMGESNQSAAFVASIPAGTGCARVHDEGSGAFRLARWVGDLCYCLDNFGFEGRLSRHRRGNAMGTGLFQALHLRTRHRSCRSCGRRHVRDRGSDRRFAIWMATHESSCRRLNE